MHIPVAIDLNKISRLALSARGVALATPLKTGTKRKEGERGYREGDLKGDLHGVAFRKVRQ